jgi:hypothetical protein
MPAMAIDWQEVLTGGAGRVYWQDALAGCTGRMHWQVATDRLPQRPDHHVRSVSSAGPEPRGDYRQTYSTKHSP